MNLKPSALLTLGLLAIATTACTTGTTVSNFVPNPPGVATASSKPAALKTAEPAPPDSRPQASLLIRSTDQGTILCTNPVPFYPPMSQKQGEEGLVIVSMELGPDGALLSSRILQSSGHVRLDRAALEATSRTRCDVFLNRQSGTPASVRTTKPFHFRLAD